MSAIPNPYTSTKNDLILAIINHLGNNSNLQPRDIPNVYNDTTNDLLLCLLAKLVENTGNEWKLGGNTIGTDSNKLGTLDDKDLEIITNNLLRFIVRGSDGWLLTNNGSLSLDPLEGALRLENIFGAAGHVSINMDSGATGGGGGSISASGGVDIADMKILFFRDGRTVLNTKHFFEVDGSVRFTETDFNDAWFKYNNTTKKFELGSNTVDVLLPALPNLSSLGTDANGKIISGSGGGSTSILVVTSYPVLNASLAGTRFLYKGNEWHYMTQSEINSTGWGGLVSIGFPAPINKFFNYDIAFKNNYQVTTGNSITPRTSLDLTIVNIEEVDFVGYGLVLNKLKSFDYSFSQQITKFTNAGLLVSLEDIGTSISFNASNNQLNSTNINSFFNELPVTTKTVTINISNNPGSSTCNPTIATSKGYIVIT